MREKEILVLVKDKWNPRAPFFVKLITSFQDEESLYFILTYAERGDFFTFLKRAFKKGINVSRFYSGELIQALEHLHNIGIVHRDLKPENLLLTRDMHILLTDFGSGMILRKEEVDRVEEEITVNRRSSFVGTAQYVSPEMLTSKGCSPASDLWAAGCIIYQMESGSPPFQSGSEYLIFQKILKLEYSFPDQFNSEGADLVKRLLTLEPEKRLGFTDICDHVCYKSIKSHPYFRDLDFENLYRTPSPHLDLYSDMYMEQDPVWDKYPDMTPGLGKSNTDRLFRETLDEPGLTSEEEEEEGEQDLSNPCYSLTSQTSCIPESGDMNDLTSEDRNKLLEEQKKNNEYHRFVENNLILKQGLLDKKKGLWSRRRMFLLTEGPRLFYVDPKEKILKGEIPLSAKTETEMRDFKTFFVITPDRRYHLTDPQSFGSQWCKAIDGVAAYYFKKTVE
ncbi:3-phosphoinositide-dependent protein kinase 1 [Eurytemora carolleeae]|uniref:3-phosphoinositide-dependent protein kinase 1 n=1 Tax=Eurytemora carolleeae TaxID=1294199 RepID=UPI000C784F35|nr:3-phosphoinositide-dependent protein kinase 1 [Eurytemora carolleeae]|eukprot:XP_023343921.1 3-phosphoinositide-dependent protein kinase 1-like [Eurytemora affinis]